MAKAAIRKLKERRFWRYVCVELLGNPEPKKPIKLYRRLPKINTHKLKRMKARGWEKAKIIIADFIAKKHSSTDNA